MRWHLSTWIRGSEVGRLFVPMLGIVLVLAFGRPLEDVLDEGALARFFALDTSAALTPEEQDAALGVVRDQLQAQSTRVEEGMSEALEAPADPPSSLPDRFGLKDLRPVWVTLRVRGLPPVRGMASGPTLYRALRAATRLALGQGGAAALVAPGARVGIQVDILLDRTRLWSLSPRWLNLALEPGVAGVVLRGVGEERWLLPAEGAWRRPPDGRWRSGEWLLALALGAAGGTMPSDPSELPARLEAFRVERFQTQSFGVGGPDLPRVTLVRGWSSLDYASLRPEAFSEALRLGRRWLLEALSGPGPLVCWTPFDPAQPSRQCQPYEEVMLRWLLAELVARSGDPALAVGLEQRLAQAVLTPANDARISICAPDEARVQRALLPGLLKLEAGAVAAASARGPCEGGEGPLCAGGVLKRLGTPPSATPASEEALTFPELLQLALTRAHAGSSHLGSAPDLERFRRAYASLCTDVTVGTPHASWCLLIAASLPSDLEVPLGDRVEAVLSGRYPPIQPPHPDLLGISRWERAQLWAGPWRKSSCGAATLAEAGGGSAAAQEAGLLLLGHLDPVGLALDAWRAGAARRGESTRRVDEALSVRGRHRLLQQVTPANAFQLAQPERFEGALRGLPASLGVGLPDHVLGLIELTLAQERLDASERMR